MKHFPKPVPPGAMPPRVPVSPVEDKAIREAFQLGPSGFLYMAPSVSQTKTGEALAGVILASMFSRAGRTCRGTLSRFMSWEDLRKGNTIVFGNAENNRYVGKLLEDKPFRMADTEGELPRRILNMKPEPGEPSARGRIWPK